LVYKRVHNHIEKSQTLLLSSDNKIYKPYEVDIEEVLEIWEFTCCINTQEYDEKESKLSGIMTLFQDLKVELEAVKKMT